MERVQVLIDKLIEQRRRGNAAELLLTVQLLQQELLQQQKPASSGTANVSVIMPVNARVPTAAVKSVQIAPSPQTKAPEPNREEPSYKPVLKEAVSDQRKNEVAAVQKPAVENKEPERESLSEEISKEMPQYLPLYPHFDAMAETPTLLQQPQQKEVHEVISEKKESLNDKLKQDRTELAHKLKDSPVKDLRKAIGINDKFVFVSELFRGDEGMYERSIKTINNFHILPEAEYWMNRELKVKLGWNDSKEAVQHFYQLVRRRFS